MADLPSIKQFSADYGLLEAQTKHRINILHQFSIIPGSKVLELGCGQGDCTVLLAYLIGPTGHIDAVDPAPLDYGAPETLGQAQLRIKNSDIGDRITFHQASPIDFLSNVKEGTFDIVVLCHCLWYFNSKEDILQVLKSTKGKAKRMCIAEWSLSSKEKEAEAHILTTLARATCEAHIPDSDQNIRTAVSPSVFKCIAQECDWNLSGEGMVTPEKDLQDARWELGLLLHDRFDEGTFVDRAKRRVKDDGGRIVTLLESMVESVKSSVEGVGGRDNVRCMDVWIGLFT